MSGYVEESYEVLEEDKSEEQIQQKIRLGFIRKVYGILLFQLLLTTLIVFLTIRYRVLSEFLLSNPAFLYLCIAGVLFTEIPIICCRSAAQKVPLNYILLLIFTICESFLVAHTTLYYEPISVLICAGLALAVVIALTLYAIFTKTDLTVCGGALAALSIISLILTIIGIFYSSLFYHTLINAFGVFLFSLYLIYDVQLVVGKNKVFLSTDSYIIGALMIYIDIIVLFLKILWLFGKKKK
jgi:FtsH-binding integral membrane protein